MSKCTYFGIWENKEERMYAGLAIDEVRLQSQQ